MVPGRRHSHARNSHSHRRGGERDMVRPLMPQHPLALAARNAGLRFRSPLMLSLRVPVVFLLRSIEWRGAEADK